MTVRVSVTEHVIITESAVFAQSPQSLFRKQTTGRQQTFAIGNHVRNTRQIVLSQWEKFSKLNDTLPPAYVEATQYD